MMVVWCGVVCFLCLSLSVSLCLSLSVSLSLSLSPFQVESLNDQLVSTARRVEDREANLDRLARDKDGLQVS
jgi:hypothetical protein